MRVTSRILLYLSFVLFFGYNLYSQSKQDKIDSLKTLTATTTDPVVKIKRYIKLALLYNNFSPEKEYYLQEALRLSKDKKADSLTGRIYYFLAFVNSYNNNDNTAVYYKKALNYKSSFTDIGYCNIYKNLARYFSKNAVFDSADYYFNVALKSSIEMLKQHPDDNKYKECYASVNQNMGNNYLFKADYKKAIEYYNKSLPTYIETGNINNQAIIHMNSGLIYMYFHEYDNALKEFRFCYNYGDAYDLPPKKASALTNMGAVYKATEQWDLADSVYREALMIRMQIGPERSIAGLYQNLGVIAKMKNDYNQALEYYNKALEIQLKNKNIKGLADLYLNIGNLYLKQKNYAKSEPNLLKALEYSRETQSLETTTESLWTLSKLYEEKNNYNKSLQYFKEFKILDDSIHSLKAQESSNYFKEKFEAAEKDRKLSEYRQQQQLDELEKKRQKMANRLLGAGIFMVVIVFILVLILLNNRRKAEKRLFEKNVELNKQKMLELVKEQEMNSINSFIHGQEKERSRIASDLHDRLGSLLSTVKLHFSSLESHFEEDKELHENFNYAISLLDKSVSEVRSVSHNLAKEILTEFGLVGAVENLRDAINSSGTMKLIFVNSGFNHRLSYEYEIEIYRIIQELVTNAIKHSKASEIIIQFVVTDDILTITVEDDGVGFDIGKIKKNGMGLDNIFKRTAKIKGRYSIDSTPGNGATFIFEIPVNPNKPLK